MPEPELTCSVCGSAYAAAAYGGSCPRCLMGAATMVSGGSRFEVLPAEELNGVLTDYEVAELVGTGGMGAVYRARQMDLGREVAIKLLSPEAGGDPEFAERFAREAKVLGALAHPNIVPVYGIGFSDDGLPFYSMKLVKGRTLQEIIGQICEGDPGALKMYSLASLLTIFRKVCDAMAFAHSQGILHRDLKPANVMVGEFGEVLVMDWGLAKMTNSEGRNPRVPVPEFSSDFGIPASSFTLSGAVLGTPQYMSPEQARGESDSLDERADIFSLGGILYAILTLRPPVEGSTMAELLEKARSGSVVAPTHHGSTISGKGKKMSGTGAESSVIPLRQLPGGRVPAALSAVVMKAMARAKEDRYQTVGALSADVEAWQGGFATSAEKAGTWTQLKLLMRRHRVLTAMLALLIAVSAGFVIKVVASERRATANAVLANRHADQAKTSERVALATLAESHVSAGLQADTPAKAALFFDRASAVAPDAEAQLANRIRTREWSRAATRIVRAFIADGEPSSMVLHPSGRFMRVGVEGRPGLFDVAAEKRIDPVPGARLLCTAWSPDGSVLAAMTDAEAALILYDLPALTIRARLPTSSMFDGPVVFSEDGSLVAAGVGRCWIWSVSDGRLVCTIDPGNPGGSKFRWPVGISSDCTRIIIHENDNLVLFPIPADGSSPKPILPPFPYKYGAASPGHHACPAFVPGGSQFVHVRKSDHPDGNSELVWRDSATGAERKTTPDCNYFGGFSPDGTSFFASIGSFVGIFDAATGEPRTRFDFIHTICGASFSPDGSRVLLAAVHGASVPAFSTRDGQRVDDFAVQRGGALHIAFSEDGAFAATAQRTGLIQVFSLAPPAFPPDRVVSLEAIGLPHGGQSTIPVIHPGGRLTAVGGNCHAAAEKNTRSRVLHIASGEPAGPVLDPGGQVLGAEFTPDGDTLALLATTGIADRLTTQFLPGGKAGNVQLWDWKNGTRNGDPIPMPSEPRSLIFRDGKADVWCGGGDVVEVDLGTRAVTPLFRTNKWEPVYWTNYGRLAVSPDGGALFAWQQGDLVTAWDLAAGRFLFPQVATGNACADLAFLPATPAAPGLFATVEFYSEPSFIRFFDLHTGQAAASRISLGSDATRCFFSPDGQRLLIGTIQGKSARLYDWRTGAAICPEVLHTAPVYSVAFVPGSSWCLSGDMDGIIRLWDGDTGKLLIPPLKPGNGAVNEIKVTPDGHHALYSPEGSGTLHILDLPALRNGFPLSPEGQQLLCELNAGATAHPHGGILPLDAGQWYQRWVKLRALHPEFHAFPRSLPSSTGQTRPSR